MAPLPITSNRAATPTSSEVGRTEPPVAAVATASRINSTGVAFSAVPLNVPFTQRERRPAVAEPASIVRFAEPEPATTVHPVPTRCQSYETVAGDGDPSPAWAVARTTVGASVLRVARPGGSRATAESA